MTAFFTLEKIEKHLIDLRAARYREARDIPTFKFREGDAWQAPGAEQPDFDDRDWADFRVGDSWGGYDVVAWFRARVLIPSGWAEHKLALRFEVGPRDGGDSAAETMLYAGGEPLQGLDLWHTEAWLPPEHLQASQVAIALKAWSGVYHVPPRRRFTLAQLVWLDEGVDRLVSLMETLLQAVRTLDENDLHRLMLLEALNQAAHRIDFTQPGSQTFYESLRAAADGLAGHVRDWQALQEIKPSVVAIGQAHIDMAWLWRVSHTREKAAHTFATALHLMRQFPEYRFLHSSPQLYKFLQHDYPGLFARVKERIALGAWEATGGMWIEADTNVPNGESLVRQFLLGQEYLHGELGVHANVLWLPDVFGYSAALPQLIAKSGLKYFLTTKISWSQFNRFPYDTFRWRGLDGTEVLTHFVTTPDANGRYYTYNGLLAPGDVQGLWNSYRQKDANTELLLLYGWGDGGGGPTREMLEAGRVLANLPGLPRVTPGLAEPFFERLEQRVAPQALPVWDGELYLEYHRGTYTSQAASKRANRQAEVLYHAAEWLSAVADLLLRSSDYPAGELRQGWELILLNQFHDILPGSSIHEVYEDSQADYARVRQIGEAAVARAQAALLAQIAVQQPSVVVFNPLGWARDELIALPWSESLAHAAVADAGGAEGPAAVQVAEGAHGRELLFIARDLPALGYAAYPMVPQATSLGSKQPPLGAQGTHLGSLATSPMAQAPSPVTAVARPSAPTIMLVTPRLMENAYFRLELNEHGQITSLFDRRHARQVLPLGAAANVFQAFEDRPMQFDAWDIDLYYQEKLTEAADLVEAVVEESGPLRGVLRLQWRYADSLITQRLTLYVHTPRIDFRTEVDWHQHQVLLKVAFPVAVRATRATYEIQFGSLERPTHWNTSWDWSRFEVCAHKWADLSEGDYGVALLNDCKYGYDVKDNVLRLTLIKSGIDPDPQADQGRHTFTYSLLPHAGDWRQGGVIPEAYALNYPAFAAVVPAAQAGPLPGRWSLVSVDADHVIVETVKQAETIKQGENVKQAEAANAPALTPAAGGAHALWPTTGGAPALTPTTGGAAERPASPDSPAIIVRVYECQQRRSSAVNLDFGRPMARAVECNLVEEGEEPVDHAGSRLTFAIAPFEIKTFKVWFK